MGYVGAGEAPPSECVFCSALAAPDDRKNLVLHRAAHAFLVLNAYPYAPGHLMAVLNRHVGTLAEARADEVAVRMELRPMAITPLTVEYRAVGIHIRPHQAPGSGAPRTPPL